MSLPGRQIRGGEFWALAGLVVLVGCAPVWTGQWLSAHEGPGYLFRASEFASLLSQGEIYPRWCPDFYWGYGYPFFVFYSPGLFYLTAPLLLLGVRADIALHLATVLGTLVIFLGGYRLCRLFASDGPARVGAVLMALATYRFVQYYVRGDLAEAFATSLVPWALAEAVVLCRSRSPAAMARLAALLAAVFYAHTLTAVATSAALGLAGLAMLVRREPRGFARVAAASGAGALLAGAQWIPAVLERRYVSTERMVESASLGADWRDHFVTLWQRVSPRFGFGLSIPGPGDKISFGSNWAMWALAAVAAALLYARPSFRRRALGLFLGWLAANVVQLSVSTRLWSSIPLLEYFQFPWRFLLLDLVLGAALAAAALDEIARPGAPRWALLAGAAAIAALAAVEYPDVLADFQEALRGELIEHAHLAWWWPHAFAGLVAVLLALFVALGRGLLPAERLVLVAAFVFALPCALAPTIWAIYKPMPLDDQLMNAVRDPRLIQRFTILERGRRLPVTTAAQDEYRPKTAKIDMSAPPEAPARMMTGAGSASIVLQRGTLRRYDADVSEPGLFEAASLVYPGVCAAVDGARVEPTTSDLGLVAVPLASGHHTVEIWYAATPARRAGAWTTALGAASVIGLALVAGAAALRRRESGDGASDGAARQGSAT